MKEYPVSFVVCLLQPGRSSMPDILGFRLLMSSQIIQHLIPNPEGSPLWHEVWLNVDRWTYAIT